MNVLIVDDEPLALDVLETYLEKTEGLRLVGRCTNAVEADDFIRNNHVDLLFLDIQMPQLSGIDLVKSLAEPPMVVFTSAFPKYAIQGFDLNILDFLLKPFGFDRFMKTVTKARELYEAQRKAEAIIDESKSPDHFFVKADKKLQKINFDEIIYVEGLKDYVIIRQDNGRVITLQTMKSLEDRLPSNKFQRVHRSYIVALDRITALQGNSVEVIEKEKPKLIPIGKLYRNDLLAIIDKNKL